MRNLKVQIHRRCFSVSLSRLRSIVIVLGLCILQNYLRLYTVGVSQTWRDDNRTNDGFFGFKTALSFKIAAFYHLNYN